MKQIYVFSLFLVFTSCEYFGEYFNVKKTSSETILNEELQTFNWKEIDAYPTFSSCDSSVTKMESERCFERTLTSHITNYLQKEIIVVTQDVNDTILLDFQVSEAGVLSLLNSKIDSITLKEIPNIEKLLVLSLDSLPKVFPAIKRGQQVKTQFKLPVIITVN
ncbi:hypothetical protein APS56_12765 [Pseudalgibacter alginicilyticus]|uniref:TonB C-terminal domain-containing protein n=1 Tax=Pseudalgibacter alginicilyticus TaxID=1736674 RepID=A0A0N7HYR0_9FLAO|nr:hypothetical protein [Pseudalgibacter alginicilyticus]ALJ05950.1 hypothetical protein APS56_12765 [Pseudalgibacter alginicilyticus]